MTLCRLIFLLFNINYFSAPGLSDFLYGIRFDFSAIAWYLLPYYLFYVTPIPKIQALLNKWYVDIYFILIVAIFITGNSIDVIYYKFILKRSTFDVFSFISTGSDTKDLLPLFVRDYWYMFVIGFATFFLFLYINSKIKLKQTEDRGATRYVAAFLMLFTLVIAARGGFQLKPLNIIDASRYSAGQNVPLLINTPFSIMKTLNAGTLKRISYYEDESELQKHFDPLVKTGNDSATQKKNVVLIIMESLSKEYIGYYNNGIGFTPFLDSLMQHSIVFENAYANGKKSIEALPAILSGLPNLMTAPYNSSPYAGNRVHSLAAELKKHGYSSHFFHGGKNGTMGFDSYTSFIGFDAYYGKDEYNNDDDFDGSWGIFDLPYFQYVVDVQSDLNPPFFTTVFSLSAHHPYKLPEGFKEKCPKGPLPIHATICYSDIALKEYFKRAKNEAWYEESIFIITADHTAQNINPEYGTSKGIYAIPIIFFDPSEAKHESIFKASQQTDITPSILDYLAIPSEMKIIGQSVFSSKKGMAINYLNDIYQLIEDDRTILFDGDRLVGVYDNQKDPLFKNNLMDDGVEVSPSLDKLKAIIQVYNNGMIDNSFVSE